jgi:hypothetical protein
MSAVYGRTIRKVMEGGGGGVAPVETKGSGKECKEESKGKYLNLKFRKNIRAS